MSAPCPAFGFTIHIELDPTVSDRQADVITDDLIELLERNGLMTGGGGDRVLEFVVSREGSQATHADRELLIEWARQWVSQATISVGDLVDLNQTA
jgi:uncharacterized protein YggL (DUF469 family)